MNTQYYDHAFQQYISDMVSVNRSLPDRFEGLLINRNLFNAYHIGGMNGVKNLATTSPQ